MCRKLVCFASITLVFSMILSTGAQAADPSLVGWWRLDDGSGPTATDSSGNGNDGTLTDGAQWAAGKISGAVEFDGVDDYVDIPHAEILTVDNEVTAMAWIKTSRHEGPGGAGWQGILSKGNPPRSYSLYTVAATGVLHFSTTSGGGYVGTTSTGVVPLNEWVHVAAQVAGGQHNYFINGEPAGSGGSGIVLPGTADTANVVIGRTQEGTGRSFLGLIDDVRVYNRALSQEDIQGAMLGEGLASAFGPTPEDGALVEDTWVNLSWKPGDFAVSHDVYMGENLDDVNDGAGDTPRGNQTSTFFVAGFPGFPYPDGLVPGATYYWRIDEVNDADPNSPWKGDVWSFSIPSKTGYNPDPAEGAMSVALDVTLSWQPGFGAKLHTVYFGDDYDTVSNAAGGFPQGTATYSPSTLKAAKTYYWRVDEFDAFATHKGDVWSFTTEGGVSGPDPVNGAADVKPTVTLGWSAGYLAASHEVYFGEDADAVKNADKTSPEYKGPKALGEESYDPGALALEANYYWRIDEVNSANADSPWAGNVWSFTTGGFSVVEDFEDYTDDDAANEAIWQHWIDGFGVGTNGSQVGYVLPPYAEQTTVNGGNQSMPLMYANTASVMNSQAELKLTAGRDWTDQGVAELSIWFQGQPGSVGSFVEGPAGTFTMTGAGSDIWTAADEFHYAYRTLTGVGSIQAKIESVERTDNWAKAGVMIRESLDAGSKFAGVYITPTAADGTATNGCRFQARTATDTAAVSDSGVATTEQTDIIAPYWVKLERDVAGNFRGYYSSNGTTWQSMSWNPQNISMSGTIYIGLALTSHNVGSTCEAVFSNVSVTGAVGPQWEHQDIGIANNAPEPLYVAVSNSTGAPAVVTHDDPAAATIDTWTEWVIPLQAFADQGINLSNIDKIAIGLGANGGASSGGSGVVYIDDIRLYRPRN